MKSLAVLPLLLLVGISPADEKPTPKLPLGKDTTYVTGPLDKDGYIDYEAALNERLSKGTAPEKNANVLLWKAFGPTPEGGDGMPPQFFKYLGIAEPPKNGDYFIGLSKYLQDVLKIDREQINFQLVNDEQFRAGQRPWSAKDLPNLAGWLKANDKPLALIVEATMRPAYFNPLASKREEGKPSSLIKHLLPGVQKCREVTIALTARAMLKLAEGKQEEAWADLLAVHRLARHLSRSATLLESLVAVAINQLANNATLAYLDHADLNSKQLRDHLKELQALPPIAPTADKIDLGERFIFLDSLQMIRRGDELGSGPNKQLILNPVDS